VRGVDDGIDQGIHGCLNVDQVHAGCRHHHLAGRHVCHADDPFQHDAGLGSNDVVVFRFGQRFYELGGRVGSGMDELSEFAQKSTLVFLVGRARGMWV
jgi:hypothetical protein